MDELLKLFQKIWIYTRLNAPLMHKSSAQIGFGTNVSFPLYENSTDLPVKITIQNNMAAPDDVSVLAQTISGAAAIETGFILRPEESRDLIIEPGGRVYVFSSGASNSVTVLYY